MGRLLILVFTVVVLAMPMAAGADAEVDQLIAEARTGSHSALDRLVRAKASGDEVWEVALWAALQDQQRMQMEGRRLLRSLCGLEPARRPLVKQWLSDPRPLLVEAALFCLSAYRDIYPEVEEELTRLTQSPDQNLRRRAYSAIAAQTRAADAPVQFLWSVLNDQQQVASWPLASEALAGLWRSNSVSIADERVDYINSMLQAEQVPAIIAGAGLLDRVMLPRRLSTFPHLLPLLAHEQAAVRKAVFYQMDYRFYEGLPADEQQRLRAALVSLQSDPEPDIVRYANRLMADIEHHEARQKAEATREAEATAARERRRGEVEREPLYRLFDRMRSADDSWANPLSIRPQNTARILTIPAGEHPRAALLAPSTLQLDTLSEDGPHITVHLQNRGAACKVAIAVKVGDAFTWYEFAAVELPAEGEKTTVRVSLGKDRAKTEDSNWELSGLVPDRRAIKEVVLLIMHDQDVDLLLHNWTLEK